MQTPNERSALEKIMSRVDYWRMVRDSCEEGSGVRSLAERMMAKWGKRAQETIESLSGGPEKEG